MYGHLLHKVIHFLTVNPSVRSSVPYYPPLHSHPYCESFLTGIHSLPSSMPYCQLFHTVIPSLQSFVPYCHSFRTVIRSIPSSVPYLQSLFYLMSWISVGFLILEIFSITGFPQTTWEACDLLLNNHVSSRPSSLGPDSKHSIPKHAQPALF